MMKWITTIAAFFLVTASLLAQKAPPAGILLYARTAEGVQLLLADHPKDGDRPLRGWGSFGGMPEEGETPAQTAARETEEETHGYFKRDDLAKRLEGQTPFMDGPFAVFFLEIDYVPVEKLVATPLPAEKAFHERGPFAWIPATELAPYIMEGEGMPAGQPKITPKLLPADAHSDWFWPIWIKNMRACRQAGVIPWLQPMP